MSCTLLQKKLPKTAGKSTESLCNIHTVFYYSRKKPNTPCNRTAGQKIAADSIRGRVFEISQADLCKDAYEQSWRKVRVQCEEVKGYDAYTNFYGMDITRDKLC